ncbi:MAG: hypothetical protein KIS96_09935 [Bauldia sp.]|nr:hypothetical protein [Bauldia sp.]
MFEIYRSKHNPEHYVAIDAASEEHNAAEVRASQNLEPFSRFVDDGAPRLGFDAEHAKASIAEHGFYAFALTVTPRDHIE